MSKHEVKIGAGDWFDDNPKRIGIYNCNYIGNFEKRHMFGLPWSIATKSGKLSGKRFKTHAEATAFVREHLTNQAVARCGGGWVCDSTTHVEGCLSGAPQ